MAVPAGLAAVARDDFSAPFFDACADSRLMLRYSPSSGQWSEPAALVCSVTQADDLQWREACGRATLISWTVRPDHSRGDDPPEPAEHTVVAIIETQEGPWLTVVLVDADPATLTVGAPVRVEFVRPEASEYLPVGRLT